MFTAIGGLRNHQVMLDVTANNIANVNTVGYKSQRVAFESMMAQVMRGAAAPVPGTIGGSGPTEVGLGMTLNSIGSLMTQGSLQTTGQWSDIGLNGDGYFMVGTGLDGSDLVQASTQVQFTRAGNFTVDKNGYLTDQHGNFVLGLQAPPPPQTPPVTFGTTLGALKLPSGATSVSIDQNGVMSYDLNGRQILGKLQLAKFPNPAALSRVGANNLEDSPNSGIFDPSDPTGATNGGNVLWGDANTLGLGSMASGALEMSNVDLALEFTNMIVAQRGFQANTRVITTSDEVLQELVNLKR
jgi:flagellar hook protein FlgE